MGGNDSRVRVHSRLFTLVLSCALGVLSAQTARSPGRYTARQAAAGRVAYEAYCASCHLADLAGRNEAPQLAGNNFMRVWGPRTISDLLGYMQRLRCPGNRGALGQDTYINIVAFLLEANGAIPGDEPITLATAPLINSIANGQMAAALRQSLAQSASRPVATRLSIPKGLTVAGEVKNYVPVTDEMLRNPRSGRLADDPPQLSGAGATARSTQITRDNVQGPAARVGVGDERRRREPADAARAQRHHLSRQHRQHRAGARRRAPAS